MFLLASDLDGLNRRTGLEVWTGEDFHVKERRRHRAEFKFRCLAARANFSGKFALAKYLKLPKWTPFWPDFVWNDIPQLSLEVFQGRYIVLSYTKEYTNTCLILFYKLLSHQYAQLWIGNIGSVDFRNLWNECSLKGW